MSFSYIASGTLSLYSCASVGLVVHVPYQYAVGSILYLVRKAQKGLLYPIAVKRIDVKNDITTGGQSVISYVDTNNMPWSVGELCSKEDAKTIAINYYQNQITLTEQLINCQL